MNRYQHKRRSEMKVCEIMTQNPETVNSNESIKRAADIMNKSMSVLFRYLMVISR
jgi:CBS domain-containing protein